MVNSWPQCMTVQHRDSATRGFSIRTTQYSQKGCVGGTGQSGWRLLLRASDLWRRESSAEPDTWSHITICSDTELRWEPRESFLTAAIIKWIYLYSCLSSHVQRWSAEVSSIVFYVHACNVTEQRGEEERTRVDDELSENLSWTHKHTDT